VTSQTDADAKAVKGIAINGISGPGTWEYAVSGSTFTPITSVSDSAAILLPATATLEFIPALHQSGVATISYRAWDTTQGTAGKPFAIAATGGSTAFSSSTATASLTIVHVNHAPTWTGTTALLTPVLPNNSNPAGDTVASVFGPLFSDIDGGTTPGIAITGLTGTTSGTWQYLLASGGGWINIGSVSASHALLLSGNDLIRFVPNAGFLGAVTLTASAWDGSNGLTDGTFATTSGKTGGTNTFSTTSVVATCLVNTAPTLA
jgi:hypothetical protein